MKQLPPSLYGPKWRTGDGILVAFDRQTWRRKKEFCASCVIQRACATHVNLLFDVSISWNYKLGNEQKILKNTLSFEHVSLTMPPISSTPYFSLSPEDVLNELLMFVLHGQQLELAWLSAFKSMRKRHALGTEHVRRHVLGVQRKKNTNGCARCNGLEHCQREYMT